MIVGFPGETEEDINELMDFVEEARFERLGVFTYSDEDNAASYPFGNKVPVEVMEEGRQLKLVQMHKAESDLAVAAASILARDSFVQRLASLGQEFDLELPKGASSKVDAAGAAFLKKHGMAKLGQTAKLHFRTTQKIQPQLGQAE